MPRTNEYSNGGFQLRTLDNGWRGGQFQVLEALDVPHLVTTFKGPDVQTVKTHTYRAGLQVARVLGLQDAAFLNQVHGARVLVGERRGLAGEADGLATGTPGLLLVGKSADCPLILVADPRVRAVGFAHASWRATLAGVTSRLIQSMQTRWGCKPADVVACVCPSVGPECFEIGPEVRIAALREIGPHAAAFFLPGPRKEHFDLWQANADALQRCGLVRENIHVAGLCTLCEKQHFPSYRGEGAAAGRFIAAIGISQPGDGTDHSDQKRTAEYRTGNVE